MFTLIPINPISRSLRHCFLAKRISRDSCLWKGRNKKFGFVWNPWEYVRKKHPSTLRPALLLIEKKKGSWVLWLPVSLLTPPSKVTLNLWKDLTLPHLAVASLGTIHSCSLQTLLHLNSPSVHLVSLGFFLWPSRVTRTRVSLVRAGCAPATWPSVTDMVVTSVPCRRVFPRSLPDDCRARIRELQLGTGWYPTCLWWSHSDLTRQLNLRDLKS